MSQPESHEAWLRHARRDLEIAQFLANNEYHEWACYCALQAAEKVEKAFYYALFFSPPEKFGVKGHDLRKLPEGWRCFLRQDNEITEAQTFLNHFDLSTRYPNVTPFTGAPFENFNKEHSANAIASARKIVDYYEPIVMKAAEFSVTFAAHG